MGKTERLYQLETALRAGTPILDAPAWARRLGVDLRTFQRYLRFLRQTRSLPVYYDSHLKGYRLQGSVPRKEAPFPGRGSGKLELLALVQTICAEPGLTASQLAKKLNCSVRTFHRQRHLLNRLSILLHRDNGYRITDQVTLRSATFEPAELVVLYIAVRHLRACYCDEVGPLAERVLEKLASSSGKSK